MYSHLFSVGLLNCGGNLFVYCSCGEGVKEIESTFWTKTRVLHNGTHFLKNS